MRTDSRVVLLALLLAVGVQAQPRPTCENALPPGKGFGGSVTITADCTWRPQLHFISAIRGEQAPGNYPGGRGVPTIYFEPASLNVQSGPSRLSLYNVVLANFTLSSPSLKGGRVLWPLGLLPTNQQTDSAPSRLYLNDIRIVVSAQTIREYVSFLRNNSQTFYTDNSTFVHVPQWSDAHTTANNVGLLLAVNGASPSVLAGTEPAPGRNFVLAADSSTLLSVMQSGAAVRTSVPFLMYLSSNISFSSAQLKVRILPVNRPLIVVGLSTDNTSIDFGMEVNSLQLGPLGSITLLQAILENLAPGDARSAELAGPYEVSMTYYLWAVAFDRGAARTPRLVVDNCTLIVSKLDSQQFLFKATLFRVRPAGFTQHLQQLLGGVSRWDVSWVEDGDSVYADAFYSTALRYSRVLVTAEPMVVVALPLPLNGSARARQPGVLEYQLTHVGQEGLNALLPELEREVVMLTTNITFKAEDAASTAVAAAGASDTDVAEQLHKFLSGRVTDTAGQHVLMGIVTPPITVDVAYSTLVPLPPAMPAGHFGLVNIRMMHLPQGPRAALADANVLLPDVWTHLLWSIPRTVSNVVYLSNVTLWVPAAEFSFIRSHTAEQPTSFTINLQGDANMRFYNVRDLRAAGVYVQSYKGPGLEAKSLTLRVEAGWSMNGQPPRGFWATSGQLAGQLAGDNPETSAPKMSDAMVVVLAACLVTAMVASVLACLAFMFYRKRAAEHRLQMQRQAELEEGKSGSEPGSHDPRRDAMGGSTGSRDGSQGGSAGGSGPSALTPGARRSRGILQGLLRDSMPVHDSSDSYTVPEVVDRVALTAELARSKFGPRNLAAQDGEGPSDSSNGSDGVRRGRSYGAGLLQPPATAAGGVSTTSMASDACLARLQSAISVMSQDVLSRRLQYAAGGADGSPVYPAGGQQGGVARRSPLVLGQTQQPQQQQQLWLTPPLEAAGEEQLQRQASGSLLARSSSSSLARSSMHAAGSPSALVAIDQQEQQRDGWDPGVEAVETPGQQQQRATGAGGGVKTTLLTAGGALTAAGAGGGLAKSSYGSSQASRIGCSGGLEQLKLLQLVGQGTFGQVYKALWRRRCVAVKVLQLPATAGSSDVPWKGMGRTTSHREKMAVMETVVSTTMSHPNIVQVYTYVLQPLMQGTIPHSSKQQQRHLQQQEREHEHEQLLQQQQHLQQQVQHQQQQELALQQQPQQGLQGAAAQLLARLKSSPIAQAQQQQQQQQPQSQPQQPGGKLPPDLSYPNGAAAAAVTGSNGSPRQQQQQASTAAAAPDRQRSGSLGSSRSRAGVARDDSSQSLPSLSARHNSKDLSRLTPEMAKAAAAALPAAAAAAAGGEGGEGFWPRRLSAGEGLAAEGPEAGDSGGEGSMHDGPSLVGWQLRLVMEFCDAGSLRTALDHKLLIDRTTGLPALECVLFLAHDVACAMIHLHSEHLLHGDLKASNVLLKRTAPRLPLQQDQQPQAPAAAAAAAAEGAPGVRRQQAGSHGHHSQAGSLCGQGLGLMAKVADFGLSLTLGPTDTHVSQMHMGTLTHMAPELLLHGRASKASDVYAFGILLWELATGRRPYSGTPVGMLAHKVVQQGWRPAWPGGCSMPVKLLVESCWTQDPADRPNFEQVVQQLEDMAGHLDELKQQQAHAMAAAAAPLFQPGHGGHLDSDAGHELTPSMMDELMPSGFGQSAGAPADIEEEDHCSGVLYEMSQISSGSQDRALHLDLGGDDDVGHHYQEGVGVAERRHAQAGGIAAAPVLCAGVGSAGVGSVVGSRSHSSGNHHMTTAAS